MRVQMRKIECRIEKISPTYGAFYQHVKHAYLQSLIFNETDKAVLNISDRSLMELII